MCTASFGALYSVVTAKITTLIFGLPCFPQTAALGTVSVLNTRIGGFVQTCYLLRTPQCKYRRVIYKNNMEKPTNGGKRGRKSSTGDGLYSLCRYNYVHISQQTTEVPHMTDLYIDNPYLAYEPRHLTNKTSSALITKR